MKRFSFLSAYILLMAFPSLIVLLFVYRQIDWKAMALVILVSFFIGGVLEIWAVRQGRKDRFYIWEYNPRTTLNKKILGVAVEDLILFLILTPVFVISTWEAIKKLISVYDVPIGLFFVGGALFVLVSYCLVFELTRPKKRKT